MIRARANVKMHESLTSFFFLSSTVIYITKQYYVVYSLRRRPLPRTNGHHTISDEKGSSHLLPRAADFYRPLGSAPPSFNALPCKQLICEKSGTPEYDIYILQLYIDLIVSDPYSLLSGTSNNMSLVVSRVKVEPTFFEEQEMT